jgi:hypothetical protein
MPGPKFAMSCRDRVFSGTSPENPFVAPADVPAS